MTDARFRKAGYALMVENNQEREDQSKRERYAHIAFYQSFLPGSTQRANLLETNFSIWHDIPPVGTHFLGNKNANSRLNR